MTLGRPLSLSLLIQEVKGVGPVIKAPNQRPQTYRHIALYFKRIQFCLKAARGALGWGEGEAGRISEGSTS